MPRRSKHGEPMRTRSVRLPPDLDERLADMPNASELIVQAVREKLSFYDDELISLEISAIDQEVSRLRLRILDLESAKRQKEAILRSRQRRRSEALEARIRALEALHKIPETHRRSWLQARVDVLADCEFASVDEALAWLNENSARVVR